MTNRFDWKTGRSVGWVSEAILQECAQTGVQCIEICGIAKEEDWAKVPSWAAASGVEVWSFHLPFSWKPVVNPATSVKEDWEYTLKVDTEWMQKAGGAGVKVAVIHPSLEPIAPADREGQIQNCIEHLGVLSDVAKSCGMTLAVEDLPRTCLGNCADEMVRIMESNSDLRVCFDVNHLLKEDHVSFIRKVGKYMITTHISDYDFKDEKHWFPMQGEINWRKLLAALEEVDYNGPFLYETGVPMGGTPADFRRNHMYLNNL